GYAHRDRAEGHLQGDGAPHTRGKLGIPAEETMAIGDAYNDLPMLEAAGKDSEEFKDYCDLLYTQALLIEGILPENPVAFAQKLAKMMAK
ncbi:MAG: HAD hydrolase family protein, partial [Centipeda sp. (in: firmicutes)]